MPRALTPNEHAQVQHVFKYHPPTEAQIADYQLIRETGLALASVILTCCPPSADRSAALRKVREAVMTANAAIALEGSSF